MQPSGAVGPLSQSQSDKEQKLGQQVGYGQNMKNSQGQFTVPKTNYLGDNLFKHNISEFQPTHSPLMLYQQGHPNPEDDPN
jgi:hypothetical protein